MFFSTIVKVVSKWKFKSKNAPIARPRASAEKFPREGGQQKKDGKIANKTER